MEPSRGTRLVGIALALALGIALGHFAPQWLARRDAAKALPDVITQVRELSRLEGVSYHVERVVDLHDKQETLFGLVKAEDAILLVASGDVVAGVDLGALQPGDVSVSPDQKSVTIRLPPAEIFSARLDNDRTYVHTRSTDLLAQRKESLETEARKAAEKTLQSAAEDAGIVARAEESVGRTVRSLVRSLGFTKVQVDFKKRA
jgi:hypothetical protein